MIFFLLDLGQQLLFLCIELFCSCKLYIPLKISNIGGSTFPSSWLIICRSSDGEMILKCISSTLVVVNSISVDSCMKVDEMLTMHKATAPTRKIEIHSVECTKIDSILRSRCNISLPKLLKIRCKVGVLRSFLCSLLLWPTPGK
jgi:hypothetical protein